VKPHDGGVVQVLGGALLAAQARGRCATHGARAWWRIAVGRMRHNLAVAIDESADLVQCPENLPGLVAQDEVAQPPHDLDDQPTRPTFGPAEAYLQDALPARLSHLGDARALQMLAQQHDERGWLGDHLARLL